MLVLHLVSRALPYPEQVHSFRCSSRCSSDDRACTLLLNNASRYTCQAFCAHAPACIVMALELHS